MSKMSAERARVALNGPTMGARWPALFFADPPLETGAVQAALQAAVDEVDAQMSTWTPDSELVQLNAAAVGAWVEVPEHLVRVLTPKAPALRCWPRRGEGRAAGQPSRRAARLMPDIAR